MTETCVDAPLDRAAQTQTAHLLRGFPRVWLWFSSKPAISALEGASDARHASSSLEQPVSVWAQLPHPFIETRRADIQPFILYTGDHMLVLLQEIS